MSEIQTYSVTFHVSGEPRSHHGFVSAYSAADAVTQVVVAYGGAERVRVESVEPYRGGNPLNYSSLPLSDAVITVTEGPTFDAMQRQSKAKTE